MALSPTDLQRKVIQALIEQGLPPKGAPNLGRQPLELVLEDAGTELTMHVYSRNVTHGGKGRRDREYRIQLTGPPPTLVAGATTLLLGYFEPLDVFVSFDPRVHLSFGYSPSIQVSEAAIQRAAATGVFRIPS